MSHTLRHTFWKSPPQNAAGTPDILDVILVVSNPVRYASRNELFKNTLDHISSHENVRVSVVELALGRRPWEIVDPSNPRHLALRSYEEGVWHKENMINLGIQRLPSDWKYVAWIDADVEFVRKDWVTETLQQLQHYMVVQMFEQAVDLGPRGEAMLVHQGFMKQYLAGAQRPVGKYSPYTHWHPGYAWAARREAIEALGGLYDVSVLGSGDHLMAWGILGENMLPNTMSEGYRKSLSDWMGRAERYIHRDVGFVPGTLLHYFHGKKADRKYRDRWKILEEAAFDPFLDLKRDWQGLYQLDVDGTPRMIKFRDDLRAYYRARNEDSIDKE
jgi:hypothetical protein